MKDITKKAVLAVAIVAMPVLGVLSSKSTDAYADTTIRCKPADNECLSIGPLRAGGALEIVIGDSPRETENGS